MTLSDLPAGSTARIRSLHGNPDARKRLRELGIFENAIVQCVLNRDELVICGIWHSRIGITRDVANGIHVTHVDET